ncbi:hypothetical protein [Mucilaginibacter sp. KACC 22063]|uniref:hypothetical protein n=1 Tax=Mucilaginibacter sp. KACC 22063 TaxID=3025666 RepID=UPI00236526A5|nr:hypothetical protein [Mucilaginibacter sp. KACC 22063]WDF57261.1 hypothetical protein PQ461_09370 [Mucilaginibacter sp. KACC 22063]
MANPILSYAFQPTMVFITTTINMKLVIQNPVGGSVVNFAGGPKGDEIQITFPMGTGNTDLVTNLNFQATSPSGFSCAKSNTGNYFSIKANVTTKLQPGQTLEFNFTSVPINSSLDLTTPTATITILEYIGVNTGNATVGVTKQTNTELAIISWADPSTIALSQITTLYWQSIGGTKVVVSPFPGGDKTFPVTGAPPSPGKCLINIPSTTAPQYTYTVKVFTSDQKFAKDDTTITQNPPLITAFTSDKSGAIKVDASLVLEWFFLWGTTSAIYSNTGAQWNGPASPLTVSPGTELLQNFKGNYGNMPSDIFYQLSVNGFSAMADAKVQIKLLPVNLIYFKFTQKTGDTLSGMKWLFDPSTWKGYELNTGGTNLNILTLYQPGGKTETYYLGSGDTVHPQVQYFDFVSQGNGAYLLSWVTANLDSLVLTPDTYNVPAADIVNGSKVVNITSSTIYTLTAKGVNGDTIKSSINVTV